ncbi:hypothetical protein LTR17_012124 [Elasticomyces elasticus]|nr:hypothetical protein LTR17_012124 [Elasticomyces elasticus]
METVDSMARDGALFYSLWWTQYVLFCALSVTFVFVIYSRRGSLPLQRESFEGLLLLAERCKGHLSHHYSASQKYIVILEELMKEAQQLQLRPLRSTSQVPEQPDLQRPVESEGPRASATVELLEDFGHLDDASLGSFEQWDPSSWLELDSSAYIPFFAE